MLTSGFLSLTSPVHASRGDSTKNADDAIREHKYRERVDKVASEILGFFKEWGDMRDMRPDEALVYSVWKEKDRREAISEESERRQKADDERRHQDLMNGRTSDRWGGSTLEKVDSRDSRDRSSATKIEA